MSQSYADRQLKRVSYHEAGHAVACCLLGIPFRMVTNIPGPPDEKGGRVLGHVDLRKSPEWTVPWHDAFDPKRTSEYVASNVRMTVAGPLAETLYTRCWQQPAGVDGDDEYIALEVATLWDVARTPKLRRDWINRQRFQMLETLRAPHVWAAVDAVAQELIRQRTLTSARAHALVRKMVPCGAEMQAPATTATPGLHQVVNRRASRAANSQGKERKRANR